MKNTIHLLLIFALLPAVAAANKDSLSVKSKALLPDHGIRFKFDEEGNRYLKMNIWTQIWFRAIENNPGTAVNNQAQAWSPDAGFRRMRIQMFGQMSPRFTLMLQMGANNQSFASGGGSGTGANGAGKRAPFYFHDAYGQFNIVPEKDPYTKKDHPYTLSIGTGLHCWNGVSRLTNASTIHLLTADAPIFNWPTIEISDQLTRMFGVFAKGNLGKVGYRVSINKPFMTSTKPAVGGPAVDNNKGNIVSYNGYFDYQFFEKDENNTSFLTGSYYGKKKVFNIGAGFLYSPNSTMTQPTAGVFESHAIAAFGADVYFDTPLGNKEKDMSFTLYSVFYNYDFGKNYLRTTAVMNPGTMDSTYTGAKAMEGYGSSRYLLGTGNMWYTQTAFMLPEFSSKVRIQPYVAYTWKDLQALNQPGHYYNAGVNLLFDGNRAKISLEYNSRALYTATTKTVYKRAGEILAVIQFWL
jgi:hypothetical protein